MERITSRTNPLMTHVRKLAASASYRRKSGEFLCDGYKLLQEARLWNAAVTTIIFSDEVETPEADAETRLVQVPADVMKSIAPSETPQGVLFLCKMAQTPLPERLEGKHYVVLDGVQDPGNVGTMLRTLDAAGFDALLLGAGTAEPFSPKALRATMGAVFRVPVYACDLPQQLGAIADTHDLYAGALDGKPFFERVRTHPGVCVIIGNEGAGISNAVYAVPGIQRVKLPMAGGAESLNASVAGAIMVYDIVRLGK